MNLYGFASGDPVNFSDPFGLCPDPLAGGLGSLKCVLQDAIAGGKAAAQNAATETVHRVSVGLSGTVGHGTFSGEVAGDGSVSGSSAVSINSPNVGASVDLGAKGSTPRGSHTASVDVGLGKHFGISANIYIDRNGDPHVYGATLHIGTPAIVPSSPVGVSVDMPKGSP